MMERDFLGLSSKNVSAMVKEEANDDLKNSALLRGSGMQWSFSNKVSALPQFLSFRDTQEDRPRKTVHDPLASFGFMTISTADVFETNQKPYSGIPINVSHNTTGMMQKNLITDKQAGNRYGMTVYPAQHFDAHSIHRPQEVRLFPVSNHPNQTSPVALSTTVLQTHPNVVGSTIKPQPLGGVPVMAPVSPLPSTGSVIGTTDLRNVSKSSGATAQLTVFYNGSVSVYDDITPEKAQAIMLLAAKGSSLSHNKTLSTTQEQASIPRPSPSDGFRNQSYSATLFPGIPSSLSVTSHAGSQSGGGPSSTSELVTVKPIGASAFPNNHSEPPKVVSSSGCAATTLIPAVALPQARKASLARFLEKRKERAMNTLPYNFSKKSPDCSTPGSDGVGFSVSAASSCSFPATN